MAGNGIFPFAGVPAERLRPEVCGEPALEILEMTACIRH